ncbi:hypothetical protein D3C81_1580730 [compost metagenome]
MGDDRHRRNVRGCVTRSQSRPVVLHHDNQLVRICRSAEGNPDEATRFHILESVQNRVLHQRLKRQLGNAAGQNILILHIDAEVKTSLVAFLLKQQIVAHMRQLVLDPNNIPPLVKSKLEHGGQRQDHLANIIVVAENRLAVDGVQRVVQKMRLHLG